MTDLAGAGLGNADIALRRLVESLTQRFPDVDPAQLERRVHATYGSLREEATAESHLIALTEGKVTDDLREQGATVHVRSEDGGGLTDEGERPERTPDDSQATKGAPLGPPD
ncbi:hypothetical protein AB0J83_41755 [Actinoplanes sp. NPDC049596]|uniref:three-helix bundle dimerization domain-containing protein n=1 Tax=unclassified Actinoplanes TaxID=2626549 RepID=UPI003419AD27